MATPDSEPVSSAPTILPSWAHPAKAQLQEALATAINREGSAATDRVRMDLNGRLNGLFVGARWIIVHHLSVGYRKREDEFILLVEVDGSERPGRHFVKFAAAPRLQAEWDAWDSCRPRGQRNSDLLFTALVPCFVGDCLLGLLYEDARQILPEVEAAHLDSAFLNAVRHGQPSPTSVADVLTQIYERVGRLLHRTYVLAEPERSSFVLMVPRLETGWLAWTTPHSEPCRFRQDVNTWTTQERGSFRDPIDYLDYALRCVSWLGDPPATAGPPYLRRPDRRDVDPEPGLLVPVMLRGLAHGDLHGRNVLVAIVRQHARWPALFDYENMGQDNLLAWDFVKMETELKVRAYPFLFAAELNDSHRGNRFIRKVQDFEVSLAEQTERCYNGARWPEGRDDGSPEERLRMLLLTVRWQASLHLGADRARSRQWLDEYYFALACYAVQAGRFTNLSREELFGVYVSAGVATARFLWNREDRLIGDAATDVGQRRYPSYHAPFEVARHWLRSGARREEALALLRRLAENYGHVLAIQAELVLALIESELENEAEEALRRFMKELPGPHEELQCRFGRLKRRSGDRQWKQGQWVAAANRYGDALRHYQAGYEVRRGHYPGINVATLHLLLAALAHLQGQTGGTHLRQAKAIAKQVLDSRAGWPHDYPDDVIWHAATAGEAQLLRQHWTEAAHEYGAAQAELGIQPFHRRSMREQVQRILDAYEVLGVACPPPFDDLDSLFGQDSRGS
jgi:hypothetical protein